MESNPPIWLMCLAGIGGGVFGLLMPHVVMCSLGKPNWWKGGLIDSFFKKLSKNP